MIPGEAMIVSTYQVLDGWHLLNTIIGLTLVGGGRLTGPLLRQNDDGVVLDLGFEVVQIPAKRVLAVTREDGGGGKG